MTCYPVIIPTLNRFQHLQDCLESLSKCRLADKTVVIVALDHPVNDTHWEGYKKIKAYLPTLKCFNRLEVIERHENYGVERNTLDLIQYALDNYEACIYSEDDNVFAPGFLEFVNSGLNNFWEDPKIMTVCGYTPPSFYQSKVDAIITHDSCAWGMGIWRHKKLKLTDREYGRYIVNSIRRSLKIYYHYPMLLLMLMDMCKRDALYGDVLNTSYNILNNKYQLRPSISVVRNMGYDGTGEHCGSDDGELAAQALSTRTNYIVNEKVVMVKSSRRHLFFHGTRGEKARALIRIFKIALIYLKFRVRNKPINSPV